MTKSATTLRTLSLRLPGKVSPKARPRLAGGTAYLPTNYRQWKSQAILEILSQLGDRASFPLQKANVQITLAGKHRGDLDNLAGAILDALVQAKVLLDDRLSCVPRLLVEHDPKGELGVTILISTLF